MGQRFAVCIIAVCIAAVMLCSLSAGAETQVNICSYWGGWSPYGYGQFGFDPPSVAEVLPGESAGFLTPVRDLKPGDRYELRLRMASASPGLVLRAGLIPTLSGLPEDAIWTEEVAELRLVDASVTVTAIDPEMTLILQARNISSDIISQMGAWIDIEVFEIGAAPQPTPEPEEPLPPPTDTYACLANLWSIAYPKPGVHARLAASRSPGDIYERDVNQYEAVFDEGGKTWRVLKTLSGPGAITRLWLENIHPKGHIRIEIDGVRVHDEPVLEFFGTTGQVSWPLAEKTSNAYVSYVPMPFLHSARVMVEEPSITRLPWQISYYDFDSTESVRSYTNPLNAIDAAYLHRIRQQWSAIGRNPKAPLPGTRDVVAILDSATQTYTTLWQAKGPGVIDSFHYINATGYADLNVYVDGRKQPLDQFWARTLTLRAEAGRFPYALMLGTSGIANSKRSGAYCHFPIPFSKHARIDVSSYIVPAELHVRWAPRTLEQTSPLRLQTQYFEGKPDSSNTFYPLFSLNGPGHLSGVLLKQVVHGGSFIVQDWADEAMLLDKTFTLAGTSKSNYFNTSDFYGAEDYASTVAGVPTDQYTHPREGYRLHIPDAIPFESSLNMTLEADPMNRNPGTFAAWAFYYAEPQPVTDGAWSGWLLR